MIDLLKSSNTHQEPVRPLASAAWTARGVATALGLVLAYALVMANYFMPTIRFHSDLANVILFGAAQLLPLCLFVFTWRRSAGWKRWTLSTVLSLGVVHGLFWGALATFSLLLVIIDGNDFGFERRHSTLVDGRRITVYRTNAGATSSYGIVLRQECDLILGAMEVREIFRIGPASDARIEPLGTMLVHVSIPAYSDRAPAREQDVELQPMLCSQIR